MRGQGPSLVPRLALALGLLGAGLLGAYALLETAALRRDFAQHTDELVETATAAMTRVTGELLEDAEAFRDALVESLVEGGAAQLADIPLSLYPDEKAQKAAILQRWQAHAERKREVAAVADREVHRQLAATLRAETRAFRAGARARSKALTGAATRRTLAYAAAAALALAFAFAAALYVTVIRPVRSLAQAARRIEAGDLSHRVALRRRDEFGRLAAAFDSMVETLQRTLRELEALNRELEARVAQKTAALEEKLRELRTAQAQLLQAARMSAVGALAGGVAHEFNNLLGGILGAAETILENRDLDGETREAVGVIQRTARRACEVTAKLLSFARPEPSRPARADAAGLVRDALALLEPEARKRRVRLQAALPPEAPLRCVPREIHQVVVNVVTNALQASPPGGTVTVTLTDREGGIELAVDDEGPGVPPEAVDRIFEPFFSTKGPGAGTGLGLTVSYGIVTRHGGRLTYEPRLGGGSRFRCWLPKGET